MGIGDKIQHLRKLSGLTQEELAEVLQISRQALSKWENNTTKPDLEKIVIISEHFKVSTDYLIKDDIDFQKVSSHQEATKNVDAKALLLISTLIILAGLIIAISMAANASWSVWYYHYPLSGYGLGVVMQLIGVGIFFVSYFNQKRSKKVLVLFWLINSWFLSWIPSVVVLKVLIDSGILRELFGLNNYESIAFHVIGYVTINSCISLYGFYKMFRYKTKSES
jgi:transcriptional regulator with XRE-family HTH domain